METNKPPASPAERSAAEGRESSEGNSAGPVAFFPVRIARLATGGLLMGVANLIPGVSGGTMILAMGLYDEFIESVAEVSALRFSRRRVIFLGLVGTFAAGAILGLAGAILHLLFHYTSAMYALFIGLTLGGAPLLAKSLRPVRADVVIATVAGFGLMLGIVLLKTDGGLPHNTFMDLTSGVVASTTMVLPGISGSYMLLIMDQYDRVVGAVDGLKTSVRDGDSERLTQALWVVVPVGIGAVAGIVALSNLLKVLLRRFHRATVGVLLGILLGSVFGLYPFGRTPDAKVMERRSPAELREFAAAWRVPGVERIVDEELPSFVATNWPRRQTATYSAGRVAAALAAAAGGFAATFMLARGQAGPSPESPRA